MKINQNRPDTQKVPVNTINTMLEQISDLQTDVAGLQNEVNGLEQSIDTVNIEATQAQIDSINATNIESTNATINNITASVGVNTANLDANVAEIDTATIGTETVGTSTITDATIATANITDLDAVTGTVQHLRTGNIEANSVDADTITTKGITNSGNYNGKNVTVKNVTASDTINAKNLNVSDSVSVADINITGQVTGLSDIEAGSIIVDEIKADTAEIQSIKNHSIYTDTAHPLVPSPSLVSDSDRYTIELPTFDGTMVLTWKEGNAVRWTATVIGNGVDYGITFGCTEDQVYINELFQWNKKLYIRHSANGQLIYSYNAEKELDPITIYYNMGAWTNPKSLEELTEEDYYYQVVRSSGTVWFGKTIIPRLDNGDENNGTFNFKGSRKLNELPTLSESDVGDVWNITDEAYTDNRFVEGAGKPINAGDDIVAVLDTESATPEIEENTNFYNNESFAQKNWTVTQDGKIIVSAVTVDEYSNSNYKNFKGIDGNWNEVQGPSFYDTTLDKDILFRGIFKASNGNLIAASHDIEEYPHNKYSTDNGLTWQNCNGDIFPNYDAWGPYFIEHNNRVFLTDSSEGLYSDDFGITWHNLPSECDGGNILPISNNQLIAFGGTYITRSNDNGSSWYYDPENDSLDNTFSSVASGYTVYVNSVVLVNDTIYINVYGFNHNLFAFKSTDYGASWTRVYNLDGSYNFYSINNTLYFSGKYDSSLYKTTDDGETTELIVSIEESTGNYGRITKIEKVDSELIISCCSSSNEITFYHYSLVSVKVLKWNKFAAGVNYENFVAENITATESLKSEGTLEVDGTSQFDGNVNVDADLTADKVITPDLEVTNTLTANSTGVDVTKNITHTGNYTATGNQTITGNLNRTGNETITGVVVIGDLD